MAVIHKKLVTDERKRPVAVQIRYKDWLVIERQLGLGAHRRQRDVASYCGRIALKEDPLQYQRKMREEWA